MTVYRVTTPVPGYTGAVGSVQFKDGTADVADGTPELAYLRAAGYHVEPADPPEEPEPEEVEEADEPEEPPVEPASVIVLGDLPRKSASTDEWQVFAVANGMTPEQAQTKSRDELAAHFYTLKENQS